MPGPRPLLLLQSETSFGQDILRICTRRRLAVQPVEIGMLAGRGSAGDLVARTGGWALLDGQGFDREIAPSPDRSTLLAESCLAIDVPLLQFNRTGVAGPKYARSLQIRASDLFGGRFVRGPLDRMLETPRNQEDREELLVPTYIPDLIDAALDLLIDGETGTWRLTHGLAVTAGHLERAIPRLQGATNGVVRGPVPGIAIHGPGFHSLLPHLDDALARWAEERNYATTGDNALLPQIGESSSLPIQTELQPS